MRSTFKNYAKNAEYTNPNIQSEILIIYEKLILRKIIDEIHKSKYFTILAEEITEIIDVNKVEQFPLYIQYVDAKEQYKIVEKF